MSDIRDELSRPTRENVKWRNYVDEWTMKQILWLLSLHLNKLEMREDQNQRMMLIKVDTSAVGLYVCCYES